MCYLEGDWQAYLDDEVTAENRAAMKDHLARCLPCRRRLTAVRDSQEFVTGTLAAFLAAVPADRKIDVLPHRKGVFSLQPMWKKLIAPVAAAVILGGVLGYAPARGLAGDLLSIFRVENVQTISLTGQDVTQLRNLFGRGGRIDIRNFGRIETSGPAAWRQITPAEAGAALGVPVKIPAAPAGYRAPVVKVSTPASVTMTLQVTKINAYLTSLGDKTLLPAAVAGKPFTVTVPPILSAGYLSSHPGGPAITVGAMKSPELAVPAGVDPNSLRSALLGIPGLPADLKAQLAAVNDWQHTLLLPSVDGQSTPVEVGGTTGVFFVPAPGNRSKDSQGNLLIFEKNGVIYSVGCPGLTEQEAVALGNSLI